MKKIIFVLVLILISPNFFSQTILTSGDIAIVGFNFVNPDDFAFVLLVDITSNTKIRFTDNGWKSSGSFRSGEGTVEYTSPSNLTAGQVVVYSTNGSNFSNISGSFSFAVDGDQILAYQGTEGSPVFIYALNSEGTGWQADALDPQTSALPPGLTNGTTAVAIDEVDNAYYSGGTNSDLNALRTQIGDQTNWTGNNSIRYDLVNDIPNPLPVELSSFSAVIINGSIKLNWGTETEVNNYGFEVERQVGSKSALGGAVGNCGKIGFVEGHGNTNSPKEYSFLDDNVLSGKYSYRLKQIDNDGTYEFSKVIEVDMDAPIGYELSQNYPNPFNPETTIKFNISKAGFVKLSYYNILGELKGTIVNEIKEAGIHTVNFNASELNSGIYFYKLEADNFVKIRKMSLIK